MRSPGLSLLLLPLALCSLPRPLAAQAGTAPTLERYLPDGVAYDPAFPTPASVLGWEVGTWHVRHDQVVDWFETVAESSPRVRLETYGYTHEQRPLLLATITSPANLERIEELRAEHVRAVRAGEEPGAGPAVVWMGYSVHGNEPSGTSASLLLAYHLAAATGPEIEAFLERTIVLVDPCLNPDGLARFAHWANMHRGRRLVGDPEHREHREAWPGGRTNHYWFDLNRDWLLLTHPESRGRLEQFHRWLPQVLTDYHEMGSDATYFFQPGIPSRQNPLTPAANLELTRAIATFHAAALDELGSLYYTEESFDDFYYGKGSTYPDVHGSVGILFEQASSRGHLRENSYGGIDFPFTIRNQFTTSLSSLEAVDELRDELRGYQRRFYREAREEARQHPVRAWAFGAAEDPGRTELLVRLLRRHGVTVHRLARDLAPGPGGEPALASASSFLVPADQPAFRFLRSVFETRTSWPDNTFYDVSSWNLPLSFGLPWRALGQEEFADDLVGEVQEEDTASPGSLAEVERPVAWLFEWHHRSAPRGLARLLEAGVRARVATRRFSAVTSNGVRAFDLGTVVVPTGIQDLAPAELHPLLERLAAEGLHVHAATSGLTPSGVDLGSGSLRALTAPEPLLVVGDGVSSYEAGEVWHHLDAVLGLPTSLVERDRLGAVDLTRYTHLVLVSGASSGWSERTRERVDDWVRRGGVLVALAGSAPWAAREWLDGEDPEDAPEPLRQGDLPYAEHDRLRAEQQIAGTIFQVRLDRTHPLAFGYLREHLPVFRNSERLLPEGDDPFGTPLRYTSDPLLSGFASIENVGRLQGTPAARAGRVGSGSVLCLVDDPLFRGVWYGTERLFDNALFLGGTLERTGAIGPQDDEDGEH